MFTTQVRLTRQPDGQLRSGDFSTATEPLPALQPGCFLVRNTWLSVDASVALRITGGAGGYLPPVDVGMPIEGWAVGEVVSTLSPDFPHGARVLHHLGWRDLALLDDRARGWGAPVRLPDDGLPDSTYLGELGPTGLTAWAGLLKVARLADEDVVFVSAAAGAVGCLVVQLAIARGHRVIASAGSDAKVRYLEGLGVEAALNYRDGAIGEQLAAAAAEGIDVYFDNVGGNHLEAALEALRPGGRVTLCGAVSGYGSAAAPVGPRNLFQATVKGLTLRGFLARTYADSLSQCQAELRPAIASGRIRLPTHVVEGLSQAPRALVDLLTGGNTGKVLVHVPR